jgi:hypothetical protein
MASFYMHLVLSYQYIAAVGDEQRSAFILGAIAPDMVPVHRDKLRTHYSIYVGITWAYRYRAFERAFARYRQRSLLHLWFYRGYKYHLRLDDAWMRACAHPAFLRMAVRGLVGRRLVLDRYYGEMSALDAYHCSTVDPELVSAARRCLAQADAGLLPGWMDRTEVAPVQDRLAHRAEQAWADRTPFFRGQFVLAREAERFLQRAASVAVT